MQINMLLAMLFNVLLVILFYLLNKKTKFSKFNTVIQQVIIGITFGISSIFASENGVVISGAIINVRDSAPILSGLIFGPISGIISGFMGGLYRALSIMWGAGTDTVIACSISTFVCGLVAAALRVFMFDNKRPTIAYAVGISIICEIFHMLMIFITNMSDIQLAYKFVSECTLLMVICNSLCVLLSMVIITIINKDKIKLSLKEEGIAQKFQRWLLICILVAYVSTSLFSINLQTRVAEKDTQQLLIQSIEDVNVDISETSDNNLLAITEEIRDAYEDGNVSLSELLITYDVSEINVINEEGIIVETTGNHLYYNMASGDQSKEFLVLLENNEKEYHVQSYQPISYDNVTYRKYAAYKLEEGGFIQVGYNSERFRRDINHIIVLTTKNRHLGANGFIVVCDENLNIICDKSNPFNGESLSSIGLDINLNEHEYNVVYEDVVSVDQYEENYYYAYTYNEGYYVIAALSVEEALFMRNVSIYLNIFLQILVFSTLFVLIYFLIKKVVINNLHLINNKLGEITKGNLDVVVDIRTNKEFSSLSDDINSTVDTLKKYIDEAASRIDKELDYAKKIQLSALPSTFPAYPNQSSFDIYACMFAAKEVGGDFYDFYRIDKNRFAFLVADVSGKGIPAAMFMMEAKTLIKSFAEKRLPVNEILEHVNEKLCENNEAGMFVTAWMGIIDLTTGVLEYANAGHNPPLIYDGNEFTYLKSRPGFVLAGMEGMKYRLNQITLNPNSKIVLYTDGVTEAIDINNNMYGEEKLKTFLNTNKDLSCSDLMNQLKNDIDEFSGEAPQFDDITLLMFDFIKYKTKGVFIEKVFPAKTESLDDFIEFIEQELDKNNCPLRQQMQIKVALEEVFVNIAHYAYPNGDGNVKTMVGFDDKEKAFTFRLIDEGIPFNPLLRDDPDITLSAEERNIGGLGILITKKTMDSVMYSYENKQNILTIIKKI